MQIVITNAVLSNTGDAAICQGIIESLAAAAGGVAHDVVVMDSNARVTAARYPDWTIVQQLGVLATGRSRGARLARVFWPPLVLVAVALARRRLTLPRWLGGEALKALQDADVIVSSGGTYLVETYRFWPRLLDLVVGRLLGKPVHLWSQSLGPFDRWSSRVLLKLALAGVQGISVRDERSLRHLRRLSARLAAKAAVVPDAAFALAALPRAETTPTAIVSVREWLQQSESREALDPAAYESAMTGLGQALLRQGVDVLALSTCQGLTGYVDDGRLAREVFAGLDVRVDDAFHTPDQLLQALQQASVVVTTRMHLAILALVMRVPVVAVAYEFKTLELFDGLGLSDNVVRIEEVTTTWLEGRCRALLADPGSGVLSHDALRRLADAAALPARTVVACSG